MTLTHLQKLPKTVRDLDKLIVSKGLKKLPKVQKIAQSGHTVGNEILSIIPMRVLLLELRMSALM